jgi:hypothetical protein
MNNDNKPTPVEWLAFELSKYGLLPYGIPDGIYKKAKEMENEQRKKTWDEALKSVEKKLELLKEIYGGNK